MLSEGMNNFSVNDEKMTHFNTRISSTFTFYPEWKQTVKCVRGSVPYSSQKRFYPIFWPILISNNFLFFQSNLFAVLLVEWEMV